MSRVFEFVPGTETTPPQIRNEDAATKSEAQAAYAELNAWESARGLEPTPLPPEFQDEPAPLPEGE